MYYSNDEFSWSEESSENGDVVFRPLIEKKLFHPNFTSALSSILPQPRSAKLRKGSVGKLNSMLYSICRAGGIFYTNGKMGLKFCFGQDRESGDYTDFGGSVQSSENWIAGALREIFEETAGVVDYKLDHVLHCKAINLNSDIIIFIEVDDIDFTASLINANLKNHREISSAVILSIDELYQMLSERPCKIYSKTAALISMMPCDKLTRMLRKG